MKKYLKPKITLFLLLVILICSPLFGQLNIVPTFTDAEGETWTAERIAIVNKAIEDWENVIEDNYTIDITFTFSSAGIGSYLAQWSYSLTFWLGDDVMPWYRDQPMGAGMVHTVQFNVDRFTGSTYSWFDPTPLTDDDLLSEHYDMLTAVRHELGHALGFTNGLYATDKMTAGEVLVWEEKITITGSEATFNTGQEIVIMNSSTDLTHTKDAGSTEDDLMNPIQPNGERRNISSIDLKMLSAAYGYTIDTTAIGDPVATAPASGDGTSGNPYQIATWQNLYWLSQNSAEWDKYYIQTADIDLSTAKPSVNNWDDGAGWTPIGSETTKFTGSYNAQDHTTNGLYIYRTASNQGMFGYTDGANIQNLGLTNVNITSNGGNGNGALVGTNYNSSSINNCYSTGTVTGMIGWATGGLVGDNRDNSTISNSYSTCTVNGDGNTGGLAGLNFNGGSISNCYSTGDVTCAGDVNKQGTGGFVGLNQNATINTSYSTGNVTGKNGAGGFTSTNLYATVNNCYSFGDVTRSTGTSTSYGAFTGYNSNSTVACSYSKGSVYQSSGVAWADGTKGFIGGEEGTNTYTANFFDMDLSNQSTATGATGKTTAEMKTNSTFLNEGWSSSIWNMDSGINSGYPYLSWQNSGGSPLPVKLTFFTATVNDGKIILKWQTATEVNNYGFEIQRRSQEPGTGNHGDVTRSGDEGWEKIGFANGHGNSNSPKNYEFIDTDVPLKNLKYRLKQIDTNGNFEYFEQIAEINFGITGINDSDLPTEFVLMQNYPNPFNPSTTIAYSIPVVDILSPVEGQHVLLIIYDILGNEVATLVNKQQAPGTYEINFDTGTDGQQIASGVYFYRLSFGNYSAMKKMILLR